MPILTVPQLAETCAPLDARGKLDAVRLRLWVRRLRHWITLGILPPSVAQGSDEVFIAAILLRIASAGLPAPFIKSMSTALRTKIKRKRSKFAGIWREATSFPKPSGIYFYLIVHISDEGSASTVNISRTDTPEHAYLGDFGPRLDTVFVLNLSEVFRMVRN